MKHLLVRDWMQTKVISAPGNMGMLEAHRLMRMNNIRRLPVIKRNGQLVGIMTRSDVRRAEPSEATSLNVWEINYLLAKLKIKEVMSTDVITIHPDDTIKTAASLMHEQKFGALPVIDDDNKLVGIITESDIFRILIAWFNEEIGEATTDQP